MWQERKNTFGRGRPYLVGELNKSLSEGRHLSRELNPPYRKEADLAKRKVLLSEQIVCANVLRQEDRSYLRNWKKTGVAGVWGTSERMVLKPQIVE